MKDLEDRLVNCFSAVFPKRSRAEILSLDRESLEEWDSLAGITLLTVLNEEFAIEIDLMDLDELRSFPSVLAYVSDRTQSKD